MLNVGSDFEEYRKLEKNNVGLIRKEDLPSEFSDNAYKTITDFIQKTKNLDYEWAIFFDYLTGEILKCAKGISDAVKINFEDDEFEGCHVASIHNHSINAFSPPSGKNFNIFQRNFEDYELIVGRGGLWILEAKGIHEDLIDAVRKVSSFCFMVTLSQSEGIKNIEERNKFEDLMYGGMLSKFINDKNINCIQLTKKEYVSMTNNSKKGIAEFEHFESTSNPDDYKLVREFLDNPDLEENKQRISDFFDKMNVEIDADDLANSIPEYKKLFNFENMDA
jgi:hypothetical protein